MSALLDLLKQKKQDLAAGKRRKTLKLGDGRGRYRILQSWRGEGQQFWHDFGQHFVKNADKTIAAIYMCTDKTFGRPCAICEAVASGMKGATDDATMELLKEAKSNGRVLVNALHLDGKTPDEVQILELPPTVFAMVVEIAQEWEEAGESILGIGIEGKDLIVNREGTGKNTKYQVQAAAKTTSISADVLTKLHDLDAYVQQESSEQQTRALNSVRSVAGLLAAPTGARPSSGLPAAAAAAGAATLVEDEDEYAVAAPPKGAAAKAKVALPAEDEITDVPDLTPAAKPVVAKPAAVKAVAKPAAAVVTPVAAADESTGDEELDDLLAELDK